jgi:hypothetical protein
VGFGASDVEPYSFIMKEFDGLIINLWYECCRSILWNSEIVSPSSFPDECSSLLLYRLIVFFKLCFFSTASLHLHSWLQSIKVSEHSVITLT